MIQISAVRGEIVGIDNTTQLQQVQVLGLAGQPLQLQRLQPYGVSSMPPLGTEVLVLFINGTSHAYVIGDADHADRPTDQSPADYCIYAHGHRVDLTAAGITLTPATGLPVTINGNVAINGSLTATGDVADGVSTMQTMRDTYNSHTHGGAPPTPLMP